ncbi:MAG: TIGR03086 family metal-binding protein [Acidimicrobiales bacterium]
MDPLVAHQRAQDAFGSILSGTADEQLVSPTPCTEWRVRDLIGHVIAGNQRVATGAASYSAGSESVAELAALHTASAADAQAGFASPDGLVRTYELPFGAVPGSMLIGMRTADVLTHAWDLARATGQVTEGIDQELATELLVASRERVDASMRGPGKPFGEEQPCGPEASPSDRLAAFLGRPQT